MVLTQDLRDLSSFKGIAYGYRRFHVLLRDEGWRVSAKRIYRLYTEKPLQLCKKTPKRKVLPTTKNRDWQFRGLHLPRDISYAACNPVGGSFQRIVRKVRVSSGCFHLVMTEQFSDHRKPFPDQKTAAGIRMT